MSGAGLWSANFSPVANCNTAQHYVLGSIRPAKNNPPWPHAREEKKGRTKGENRKHSTLYLWPLNQSNDEYIPSTQHSKRGGKKKKKAKKCLCRSLATDLFPPCVPTMHHGLSLAPAPLVTSAIDIPLCCTLFSALPTHARCSTRGKKKLWNRLYALGGY